MKTLLTLLALMAALPHSQASPDGAADYSVHEWGTFTSVQAGDGRPLEWNPLVVSELPEFVYDVLESRSGQRRGNLRLYSSKTAFRTLQRMETPVIYFHADSPLEVDVEVRFPSGIVTEWYPQARPLPQPSREGEWVRRDRIAWDDVRILAPRRTVELPSEASGSHYYAARGAEANSIQVPVRGGTMESEKFLFYRGVGNFEAPLRVSTPDDARSLTVENRGKRGLEHLLVLQVRGGRGALQTLESLRAGGSREVRLTPERQFVGGEDLVHQVGRAVKTVLVAEGLTDSEAAAMVATWSDSWFAEPGLRVLYTLPPGWVDEILPLTLTPEPKRQVRVFVGRAEVITPPVEFALMRQMLRYSEGDSAERAEAVHAVHGLGLGRFAEPAVRHVLASVPPNRTFSNHAWELLEAVSQSRAVSRISTALADKVPASALSCSTTPSPEDKP